MIRRTVIVTSLAIALCAAPAFAQTPAAPAFVEADFVVQDFVFTSGEPLPERSEVALLAYDAGQRCFLVRGLDQARTRAAVRERVTR